MPGTLPGTEPEVTPSDVAYDDMARAWRNGDYPLAWNLADALLQYLANGGQPLTRTRDLDRSTYYVRQIHAHYAPPAAGPDLPNDRNDERTPTVKDYRITYLRGHKFTTWRDLRRLWSRDYVHTVVIDHPDGTRTYPGMTDARIRRIAREIADSIISDARNSGPDPIAWITGNSMMPPLRSFDAAEDVHQHAANDDGEAFAWLAELIEGYLSDADVALECPESDNSLYAVDLARFEYQEDPDGETLQGNWVPVIRSYPDGTYCADPDAGTFHTT